MNKRLRPVPFPVGSDKRRARIAHILRYTLHTYREAVAQIVARNKQAQNTPVPGERCEARTRRGTPCQCKAMGNGRCRLHGGLSTGPTTAEGKAAAAANLPNAKQTKPMSSPTHMRARVKGFGRGATELSDQYAQARARASWGQALTNRILRGKRK